ncbi:hypothetical protein LX36DRAFT_140159 [Colletotrichum falcatum]|nr:hypothetical protein LX36DRAFT_140159 [Colletotrichum falcatum]
MAVPGFYILLSLPNVSNANASLASLPTVIHPISTGGPCGFRVNAIQCKHGSIPHVFPAEGVPEFPNYKDSIPYTS